MQTSATIEQSKPFLSNRIIVAGLTIWLLSQLLLTLYGSYKMSDGNPPLAILISICLPPLTLLFVYNLSNQFRDWVLTQNTYILIAPHALRMVGMGFVFLYFYNQLPALFALPAGLGDAMAAIGAVYLVGLFIAGKHVSRKHINRWNIIAFLDFVIAVAMGVATRSQGMFQMTGHPPSDPMGLFPLAIIPAFFVPFFICLHIMIHLQIKNKTVTN